MVTNKYILLTIDVEDWFQVENFKPWIPFETWDQRELRVERNVHLLLDLFDSVESAGKPESLEGGKVGTNEEVDDQNKELNQPNQLNQLNNSSESVYNSQLIKNKSHAAAPASNKHQTTYHKHTKKVRCTFFVLGWIAERLPHLVREIHARGHEIASHGCNHQLSNQLSHEALKAELDDSRIILEDIIGGPVKGFRAPSFATSNYAMRQIADSGYLYDSSYNSFSLHGRYGQISLNGTAKKGIALKISDNFFELPISNLMINRRVLPWGGGAYFRLIPLPIFNLGLKIILRQLDAYLFYAHPWEFDPTQPRVNQASSSFKFRHYVNLNKTQAKLRSLIESFDHCQFVTCSRYLEAHQPDLMEKFIRDDVEWGLHGRD